jgi:hypothetical protein
VTNPTVSVLALGALGAEAPSFRVRTRLPSAELGNYLFDGAAPPAPLAV